jgi:hypothetical protein
LFGIFQVREFFAGQRARVRKIVQLSHGERITDPSLDTGLTIDGSQEDGDTKLPSSPKTDAQDSYVWLSDVLQQKVDGKELSSAEKAEKLINAMRKEKTFLGQTQLAEIVLQTHRAVLRWYLSICHIPEMLIWIPVVKEIILNCAWACMVIYLRMDSNVEMLGMIQMHV